jgi:hypothetical protein
VADDFYYAAVTGKFEPMERNNYDQYFFNPYEEVWRKVDEPYGPGATGLYPEEYYFDATTGTWKVSTNYLIQK